MKSMAFSMVFSHPTIGNNASQWLPIIGPSAILFWSGPGKPGARSLGLYVTLSLREREMFNFTDVPLADEDTNAMLTDNLKPKWRDRASDANLYKWRHLIVEFGTITIVISWPNLQPL